MMIYVVEIQDKKGRKATKEYEVRSFAELGPKLEDEMAGYWDIRISGIWRKGSKRELIPVVTAGFVVK
jgi:hypothetical protein